MSNKTQEHEFKLKVFIHSKNNHSEQELVAVMMNALSEFDKHLQIGISPNYEFKEQGEAVDKDKRIEVLLACLKKIRSSMPEGSWFAKTIDAAINQG